MGSWLTVLVFIKSLSEGAFSVLAAAAPEGDLITKDNLVDANEAFEVFFGFLEKHRSFIQHEVDMQVVSSTSPLGWAAVEQLEVGLR